MQCRYPAGIPAFYTVRAVTHVQVLCILNNDLGSVVALPKIKDAITFVKKQKVHKTQNLMFTRCIHKHSNS